MPILKGLPWLFHLSTTFFSASALIGCLTLPPSIGSSGFISSQTALDTVMPLPLRSMLKAVTMSALVPKPMVAPSGWPASMCAPSSWPSMTRSSSTFQLACASSVTFRPSSSK